ncbi:MAG TPA: inositol monophosphatase family protein [Beijerinckiaceae bacterium]|jgi:myo-inositol-1(or 4)-monophosphatase|nr:inositol monophosphatase family protein [Beijerinckiaceae bacterium]
MIRSALMNVMIAAALKAGRGLKRDFGEVENLQVSIKGPGDFVTAADKRAEKTLFEELSRARPGYSFIMEEAGFIEGSDKTHTWHIDPLDGTTNFLHGLPIFAISIGLERDGQLVAGLVYNPATDDLYIAERGQGAYLNNTRLRVAARRDLADALITCGIPPLNRAAEHARFQSELAEVMRRAGNVRRLGSAALDMCFVAAGRCDAYWERGIKTWDMAAGIVLVREAGGFISDADGGPEMMANGTICCGNEFIHRRLLDLLRTAEAAKHAPLAKVAQL